MLYDSLEKVNNPPMCEAEKRKDGVALEMSDKG